VISELPEGSHELLLTKVVRGAVSEASERLSGQHFVEALFRVVWSDSLHLVGEEVRRIFLWRVVTTPSLLKELCSAVRVSSFSKFVDDAYLLYQNQSSCKTEEMAVNKVVLVSVFRRKLRLNESSILLWKYGASSRRMALS
jgi:hypothetical protein